MAQGKDKANSRGSCCAGTAANHCRQASSKEPAWVEGKVQTAVGEVRRVSTTLSFADRLGSAKARWAVGRMHYTVEPGLYALADAGAESPVLVTANYKMSFDRLRSQLGGIDAWILVLDTKGINVWCAAGKGTFGTEEIIRQVEAVHLSQIVSHRKLIVPQLGAPGVSAHQVKSVSSFTVVYGPVRAADVREFLAAGMKATPAMRQVRFEFWDRVVLIPVELVISGKFIILVALGLFLLSGIGADGYSWAQARAVGLGSVLLFLAGCVAGAALAPALLPWLPGRAFSVKGAWVGLLLGLMVVGYSLNNPGAFVSRLSVWAWFLMLPALASFLAMNFTGASTYTSLSGVRREMRLAVPAQVICAAVGLSLWVAARFG